jgi:hypothetical protein
MRRQLVMRVCRNLVVSALPHKVKFIWTVRPCRGAFCIDNQPAQISSDVLASFGQHPPVGKPLACDQLDIHAASKHAASAAGYNAFGTNDVRVPTMPQIGGMYNGHFPTLGQYKAASMPSQLPSQEHGFPTQPLDFSMNDLGSLSELFSGGDGPLGLPMTGKHDATCGMQLELQSLLQ